MLALVLICAILPGAPRLSDRVVVVRNDNSPVSRQVADYYARKRRVHGVLAVRCADSAVSAANETIPYAYFSECIEKPLRAYLATHPATDFIVLTKGVPIRIEGAPGHGLGGRRPSLDSYLAALGYEGIPDAASLAISDSGFTGAAWANRFWDSQTRFSHSRFGGYIVGRLDGYNVGDAKALVDRALAAEAAQPRGAILMDACPAFGFKDAERQPVPIFSKEDTPDGKHIINELDFGQFNADMVHAAESMQGKHTRVELDISDEFIGDRSGLMGYISWGSNDRHFAAGAYHSLRFAPGAIGDTAVSTSGRTFLKTQGGQSLIADLVAQGITGIKGYTDEPLLQAIASPSILFDRYTRGWTLGESLYAASRFVGWEDLVIGDPLCNPYARPR